MVQAISYHRLLFLGICRCFHILLCSQALVAWRHQQVKQVPGSHQDHVSDHIYLHGSKSTQKPLSHALSDRMGPER